VKKVLASSSEREGRETKFKGKQAAGVYEGAEPPVLRYGVVNLYLTFLDDLTELYCVGIQIDNY
jgi:hypothetical protein